jgi:hypothetical protein
MPLTVNRAWNVSPRQYFFPAACWECTLRTREFSVRDYVIICFVSSETVCSKHIPRLKIGDRRCRFGIFVLCFMSNADA